MKTYQMTTNAIKWRITADKNTDETHHQVTSPSKENKVNYMFEGQKFDIAKKYGRCAGCL